MVDDSFYGQRNKRGDWHPKESAQYPPVFVWPARPVAFIKWLFMSYLYPWNLFYAAVAFLTLQFLTPSLATMETLSAGWIGLVLLRNVVLTLLIYGGMHLWFYHFQKQGSLFKFNGKWPSSDNGAFLFGRQTPDNMFWTLVSGVPFWTAFEVLMFWGYANGWLPYVSWEEHPIYCAFILLLIPVFRDLHFYVVHRALHWPVMYKFVHYLHHKNVNPAPWSGLAMHPVEHLFYFSCVLIHCVLPSHPMHLMFNLIHAGLAPAQGHLGFDKVVIDDKVVDTGGFNHYLHHKYFECNYSDGVLPLDKWFGSFHDGSKEGQEAMDRRFQARAKVVNAKNDKNLEKTQ